VKSLKLNRSDIDLSKLMQTLRKDARKKEEFFRYIGDGPILEIGCGSGQVLKRMSHAFPDAALYGIDADSRMIAAAKRKNIPNCVFYNSLAQSPVELASKVNNVIFPASLHEIVSFSNNADVYQTFRNVHSYLTKGGVAIIWEGMRSDYGNITISDSPALGGLVKFARQFEYKKYFFEKTGKTKYSVSFDLLAEYVTKKDRLDIQMEYKETHFPLNHAEYEDLLKSTGFEISVFNKKPLHQNELEWIHRNLRLEEDISNIPVYVLIVAKKP